MLTYEMVLSDEGLFCISLVDEPAIEADFMLLSKELKLCLADEEKRLIRGAALIPDIPIYRKGADGEPFYALFSKETIKAAAISFLNRPEKTISVMHDGNAIECAVVESFILEADSTELDAPVGSWVVTLRVDDDKAWGAVKSGMLKGFSIEGRFKKNSVINLNIEKMDETANAKLDQILELIQKLVDALTAQAPPAAEDKSVEDMEAMKAEATALQTEVATLKAEIEKMKAEKIESVKLQIEKGAATGFRSFSDKFKTVNF